MDHPGRSLLLAGVLAGAPTFVQAAAPFEPPAEAVQATRPTRPAHARDGAPLVLSLPLFEPRQSVEAGFRFPTWQQAVSLSAAETELAHWALLEASEALDPFLGTLLLMFAVPGLEAAASFLPPSASWAHEEGHVASLAAAGIRSTNGLNEVGRRWDGGVVPVYGMSDGELARLKERDNAAWVRVQAAGLETEMARLLRIERDTFLDPALARLNIVTAFMTNLSRLEYLNACLSWDPTDAELVEMEPKVTRRDFAGLDCTGWVYDLYRPREPFAARGEHPAGDGVLRARRVSSLTARERRYLRLQRGLALLNLADPTLVAFPSFVGKSPLDGEPMRWSARLAHQLTSFGTATEVHLFLNQAATTLFLTLSAYANAERVMPGLEVELWRFPVALGRVPARLTATGGAWLQPAGQRFRTGRAQLGGRLGLMVSAPLAPHLELGVSAAVKSAGWVPLAPSLEAAVDGALWLGLVL